MCNIEVEAGKVRDAMLNVNASFDNIDKQITTGTNGWGFAKNLENQGQLNTIKAALDSKMSQFHREYLSDSVNDATAFKKSHSKEFLLVELAKFKHLEKAVAHLKSFIAVLVKQKLLVTAAGKSCYDEP
jgi:hypothetical protein